MGAILESAGNSVEYIPADSTLVYTSMCEGDMDLVHEVWESSFGPAFEEMVDKGCVVDAATHDTKTREEWWYPIHVEDHCPGLPDWEAMNDCAAIFSTADSGGKGSYLAGPVDWMKADQERIDGMGLNWVVNNAGTAGALWAALDVAIANNEPIVMFNWTPNFVEALYDGKFIEFPDFEPECNTDPSWGVNPDALYDCGNPKGGYLKIGVWEGFEAKWPNAFRVVQNINFANSDIAEMALYVDLDGMEPEDAADAWLADHCDRWTGWSGADTSVCPAAPEVAADSSDAIRIPIHNWSSQIAGVYIMGAILESAGNSVEYIPADSTLVYTSMCEGDMDLVHEVWESSFGPAFEEMVDKGCVVDAATHDTKTREEWWYPIHVEDHCPGLPDWEAMNDCAAIFSTADSGGKGSYLAGPVDWMKADQERIDGMGLNWVVNNAGTAGALWAALDVAIANNEPIVMFNWTPNFVEALYDGKFIEFPDFEPECNTDPSWGVNPDALYDCGNPKGGYLKIGVWEGFEAKWPNAFRVVQNVNFANSDIAEMALYVDLDGMEPEDAADAWLADHYDRWTGWVG
jgi:glycine betaine/proline transport system substrate-binding protein